MTCDPDQALAAGATFYCNELHTKGVAKIAGLDALLDGKSLPLADGNILIGGPGSDVIEGRGGNDIIDGDAWQDVQLRAPDPDNPGSFKLVNSMMELSDDVFTLRINPRDIFIVRSVKSTGASPADVDTALYCDLIANYTITLNLNGSVTVAHNVDQCPQPVDPARAANVGDGIDTLWNIEQLAFADFTIPAPQPAITVALAANPASPSDPGTSVTWTAAASGGSGNFQYQFLSGTNGGPFTIVQDFSPNPTFNWTATGVPGTSHIFRVNARQAGSGLTDATTSRLYYVGSLRPASDVNVVADPRSPQPPGTPSVLFTAAASGGTAGTYEYEYLLSANGGPFSTVKPYNTTPSFNWTDTATAGTYFFRVNARQAGSTGPAEGTNAVTYVLAVPPPSPAQSVTLTPSLASPQAPGTSVTFTAAVTDPPSGSFEYEFRGRLLGSTGPFGLAKAYSTTASWTWTSVAGSWEVQVNARSVGSTSPAEATQTITYVVAAPGAVSVDLTPSLASPQAPGTSVTFTAAVTDPPSGSFEYEFRGRPQGSTGPFGLAKAYSTTASWTWTSVAGSWEIQVNARSVGSTSPAEATQTITYVVPAPGAVSVDLTPSSPSPVAPESVTFTAAVTDPPSGSFEYEFRGRRQGSTGPFGLAKAYSTTASWTWTSVAGSWEIQVNARAVGSAAAFEATQTIVITVN
jgi:hypothetical protein